MDQPLSASEFELPADVRKLDAAAIRCDVEIGGRRLAVRRWGAGPPLVLFHGGNGSWMHWCRNIERLSKDRSLYLVDLPGFGDSFEWKFEGMADYVANLVPFIQDLVPSGRFALGGFSFGSTPAACMVPTFADRLDLLVMVGSAALTSDTDPIRDQLIRWRGIEDPAEKMQALATNLRILMLGAETEIDAGLLAMQLKMLTSASMRHRPTNMRPEVRAMLRRERPRVLAIWGAEDALVRNHFDSARSLLEDLQNGSEMHVVDGAGHWVPFEAAETVDRLVLEALSGR